MAPGVFLSKSEIEGDVEVTEPETIETAVRQLNGDSFNLIILSTGEETPHLGIGGGPDEFIVYFTSDNLSFENLVGDDSRTGTVELVCGDQLGDFPARRAASADQAVQAALYFARNVKPDPSLQWEP